MTSALSSLFLFPQILGTTQCFLVLLGVVNVDFLLAALEGEQNPNPGISFFLPPLVLHSGDELFCSCSSCWIKSLLNPKSMV